MRSTRNGSQLYPDHPVSSEKIYFHTSHYREGYDPNQEQVHELKRFAPNAFSRFSLPAPKSHRSRPSVPSPGGPRRIPDPAYAKTVHDSTRRFKESISNGDSTSALEALIPTGIITGPSPRDDLDKMASEAARTSGVMRLLFLPKMAKLALWMGDFDRAEQYASESLRWATQRSGTDRDDEDAIHDGNMVLGLIALQRGHKERAKEHLVASAHTQGSLEMRMGGPNLTLADALFKAGEREAVIEYLDGCGMFWRRGRSELQKWIERIRRGEDPQFDITHLSS